MEPEYCHCGQPLHYSNPEMERIMRRMVARLGEYVVVAVGGRKFRVQRHYVALHGIKAAEMDRLGFEEIDDGRAAP